MQASSTHSFDDGPSISPSHPACDHSAWEKQPTCRHGHEQKSARRLRVDQLCYSDKGRRTTFSTSSDTTSGAANLDTFAEDVSYGSVASPPTELLDRDYSFGTDERSSSDQSDDECVLTDDDGDGGHDVGQDGIVQVEAQRLTEVIAAAEDGLMSARSIDRLLKARPLCCKVSYQSIKKWLQESSGVVKVSLPMCPSGHMVLESGDEKCKVNGCGKAPKTSIRFWHLSLVSQVKALARKAESFDQLKRGQERAVASTHDARVEVYTDYYHGSLFRATQSASLKQLDALGELVVYLRMTTDGFKLFENRRKQRSAWPVSFTILNYDHRARFRSKNCLITSFIPGHHDSDYFDTFLRPAIADILELERGVITTCADGQVRRVRGCVLFFTGDYPAVSKALGYAGHNATRPCRFCHMLATYDPHARCMCSVPPSEPPVLRTSEETVRLWREAQTLRVGPNAAKHKRFVKLHGVRRRPMLSEIHMDFTDGCPHDPMHLLLLGWVKHITSLLVGEDSRCIGTGCTHALSEEAREVVNKTLRSAAATIPSSWGRPPLELSKLSSYKAEDWKMFGMFYGPAIFTTGLTGPRIAQLWSITSQMLHISFSASPSVSDAAMLRDASVEALKLFGEIFCKSDDHTFCYTATTHGVTHLHRNLQHCGPLLNVSQYVVERLIGQLGSRIKSRKLPETQLLNSYYTDLSLQLLRGGVSYDEKPDIFGNMHWRTRMGDSDAAVKPLGLTSSMQQSKRKLWSQVVEWAVEDEGLSATTVRSVATVPRAVISQDEIAVEIESKAHLNTRLKRSPDARQRCFVAVHFPAGDDEDHEVDVWYGCIQELVKVGVQIEPGSEIRFTTLAVIEWEAKLEIDAVTMLPLSRRRRERVWKGSGPTAVSATKVDRLAGYLDAEVGGKIIRKYVDTKFTHFRLSDPQSKYQLNS